MVRVADPLQVPDPSDPSSDPTVNAGVSGGGEERTVVMRPPAAGELAPGELLAGRFRIVRFLGRGGMGEVYEAEDEEIHGRVALKTVRAEIARSPVALERFAREVHLARKVTHPNVCRIFDISHHGHGEKGLTFLTMEMLTGETLEARLQRGGPMREDEALPLVGQMAEGLAAAHRAGVVHRDFKPANVMLVPGEDSDVRAVVTDFGLAHGAEPAGGGLTVHGDILGTPSYMAPEQISGGDVTPVTDVYSFGVVLYEVVTGSVPFKGETAFSTVVKRLKEPPPSPRLKAPHLAPVWNAVILRCLALEPRDRFESVLEAVSALQDRALPLPPQKNARPRWVAGGAALLLLGVAVLAIVLGIPRRSARPAVAVLGFQNLSRDPGAGFVGDTLSSTLRTELAGGGKLRLISEDAVFQARRDLALPESGTFRADALPRIRGLLGADLVVFGSYLARVGQQVGPVRVDVFVEDVASGETLASVQESGEERDLAALISRLGTRLRGKLKVGDLSAGEVQEVRASRPHSTEALRLYAEGLAKLRDFDALAARDLFQQVMKLEPDYPLAYSALAEAWAQLGYKKKAAEQAKQAESLAAPLPREERLLVQARALQLGGEPDKSIDTYRILLSLHPDDLEFGLALAEAQIEATEGKDALETLGSLRRLGAVATGDPRIDLTEAKAAALLSDFTHQQAAADRALARGEKTGSRPLMARALVLRGAARSNLSDPKGGAADFDRAEGLYTAIADKRGMAEVLRASGKALYDRGNLPEAHQRYDEALATYHELGDQGGEADVMVKMANETLEQGRLVEAQGRYEQALKIFRQIGDRQGEALALGNIGLALSWQGKQPEAVHRIEESRALYKVLGNKEGQALQLQFLADVFVEQLELVQAEAAYKEALALFTGIGNQKREAGVLVGLGSLLESEEKLAEAEERFRQALTLANALGDRSTAADAQLALGNLHLELGRTFQAEAAAQGALKEYEAEGKTSQQAQAEALLATIYLVQGSLPKAHSAIERANKLMARAQEPEMSAEIALAAARVAAAEGDAAGAIRRLDEAVARASGLNALQERLELGKLLSAHGNRARGLELLRMVEGEARQHGMGLIAGKAAKALAAPGSR